MDALLHALGVGHGLGRRVDERIGPRADGQDVGLAVPGLSFGLGQDLRVLGVHNDAHFGYLEALLKSNVRVPFALWNGLLARKLGTNVEKLYSKDFAGSARIPGTVTHFHSLSKRVPGVLQLCDEVCSKGEDAGSTHAIDIHYVAQRHSHATTNAAAIAIGV